MCKTVATSGKGWGSRADRRALHSCYVSGAGGVVCGALGHCAAA